MKTGTTKSRQAKSLRAQTSGLPCNAFARSVWNKKFGAAWKEARARHSRPLGSREPLSFVVPPHPDRVARQEAENELAAACGRPPRNFLRVLPADIGFDEEVEYQPISAGDTTLSFECQASFGNFHDHFFKV